MKDEIDRQMPTLKQPIFGETENILKFFDTHDRPTPLSKAEFGIAESGTLEKRCITRSVNAKSQECSFCSAAIYSGVDRGALFRLE